MAQFDEDVHTGSVLIVLTRLLPYMAIMTEVQRSMVKLIMAIYGSDLVNTIGTEQNQLLKLKNKFLM